MMYSYFYWDWTMLLMIPGVIVAIWAQSRVNRAYNTYSKMPVMSGVTGREIASRILYVGGLQHVQIGVHQGRLSEDRKSTRLNSSH